MYIFTRNCNYAFLHRYLHKFIKLTTITHTYYLDILDELNYSPIAEFNLIVTSLQFKNYAIRINLIHGSKYLQQ